MKRKFIFGISTLSIIVFLFGVLIFQNSKILLEYQTVKNDHQLVLTKYLELANKTQKSLINLYQFKSGLLNEVDTIVHDVLRNDELIDEIKNIYITNKDKAICSECHNVDQKISHFSKSILSHQEAFKNAISPVITSVDLKRAVYYQNIAIKEGDFIVKAIIEMLSNSGKMNAEMQAAIEAKEIRTSNLIIILLLITILFSAIVLSIMIRSISSPINKIVAGINVISSGNFDSNVDIASNDEFGYIARNLNSMTDNLKNLIQQRDAVTQELNELNCTLENRVHLKTQELKQAHDDLMRTEGLAIAGTIASSIAHELSTPLSTLTGYCQLINRKMPEELGLTKYVKLIEEETERCSQIMKGMLKLTRISDDEKSLTDINATITDTLRFTSLRASCANVAIKEELDPAIPQIMANGLALRQVFMNIVMNAIEAMPEGGEIHIASSLEDAGNIINVKISDSGHGISETDLNKIFKSFYTTKKYGTGLGLPICYAIIKAHDGDITARSKIGKGTTFDVFLPV